MDQLFAELREKLEEISKAEATLSRLKNDFRYIELQIQHMEGSGESNSPQGPTDFDFMQDITNREFEDWDPEVQKEWLNFLALEKVIAKEILEFTKQQVLHIRNFIVCSENTYRNYIKKGVFEQASTPGRKERLATARSVVRKLWQDLENHRETKDG